MDRLAILKFLGAIPVISAAKSMDRLTILKFLGAIPVISAAKSKAIKKRLK